MVVAVCEPVYLVVGYASRVYFCWVVEWWVVFAVAQGSLMKHVEFLSVQLKS